MITPGQQYLEYAGVPTDYSGYGPLILALDDAILEAAEDVLSDARRASAELRVLTDGRWSMWEWAAYPASLVPVGTPVRYDGCEGTMREDPEKLNGFGERELHVPEKQYPFRRVKQDAIIEALVPVPLDIGQAAATLCDEEADSAAA